MPGIVSRSVDRGGAESGVCRADQSRRQRTGLWLQGPQGRCIKEKNVILNLRDDGVAPDDVGEMCLLQRLQLGSKENFEGRQRVSDPLPARCRWRNISG